MNKRTRGGPPQRRLAKAAIRPSILVFTEGKKTEPIYLNYWRRVHRQQVLVDVSDEHGPPLTLVKRAVAQRAAIDRVEAQRKIRDLLRFEKVPTHQVLEDLVVRYVDARRRAIALDTKHELDGSPYRSNPSSEVWHLVDRTSRT
jgi:hypothetical protein